MAEVIKMKKCFIPDKEKLANLAKYAPDINPEKLATLIKIFSGNSQIINRMEWYFNQHNLSTGRFQILVDLKFNYGLSKGEGISPAELAQRYKVKSATISGVLSTLEKDGLIDRIRCCKDRRRVLVKLTEAGFHFMEEFLPKHIRNMVILLNKIDIDDLIDLSLRLERLEHSMDEFAEEIFLMKKNDETTK